MNKGLEAYAKAMGKTMNSMNKNLYLVAKTAAPRRNAPAPQPARSPGQQQINKGNTDL